ncbi:MAG: P-type DNA transfer ATPase VirB11 [Blastomonas fulva]|uniref:P-type DNA transfer ATPase VirB11 n=1 Tax=Blastomonas fulva TaxID=1550728 RepID=UPI0024E274A0|nr:P-type DNA transfer ATPase VirB11 [Blastomonas fulva]MDK2756500.1 P-type DNA transfer ATPase VirB11 [Blastomonas fulva]
MTSAEPVPIGQVYLTSYLAPLGAALARPDVTDIYVNRPHEIWLETMSGSSERIEAPELGTVTLERLARQIAALSHQGISREHPLLSAALPDGSRIQIVMPPATRGHVVVAVRKHVSQNLSLGDYVAAGAFSQTLRGADANNTADATLEILLAQGDIAALLAQAVRQRRNILVSGGTSTGKTTFLNALLREIPQDERLILIEDTPELSMTHDNSIGLLAARSELGEAQVTANDLVAASLRLRPDRIILGELRGGEALAFLRAVNTGHPGSMTTVHADSPQGAIEQITLLALQAGTQLGRSDIHHYVRSTVDVFVQLSREKGRRFVSAVALGSQLWPA